MAERDGTGGRGPELGQVHRVQADCLAESWDGHLWVDHQ